MSEVRIGTAGWAIPRAAAGAFPAEGSGLQRYAARLSCAEINTSFYRPHKPAIWQRWRDATPEGFRFAVKVPKAITHEARLVGTEALLDGFLAQTAELGPKLGPLLVQLMPSLVFDKGVAEAFFAALRARFEGAVVIEPRHGSWFAAAAEALMVRWRVARVAADPAKVAEAAQPGGWSGVAYWRLHGSPRMYWSSYETARLEALAAAITASDADERWCVFDNTASGAAAANALELRAMLKPR